jgi:hypothetical protein
MGINAILTPKDLAAGKPIEAGWYPLEITKYWEEKTKDKVEGGRVVKQSDGSTNAIFEMTILDGPEGVKGRKLNRYFNEKALGFGNDLWAVLFPGAWDKEKGGTLNDEMFRSAVGTKLKGYVKMDGKFPNIDGYMPLS